jgi:dTMP kinase
MVMFFSIDGVDGVGKSTQMELFCQWLREQGMDVVTCRDPGSTELGEALREIVLEGHSLSIHRRSEMLIYMAARSQLVEQVIRPALDSGQAVVSDRYLLANVVYQGYAGGLDVEQVWQVGQIATAGLAPDLTFVLDMDVHAAGQRMNRELDRMEMQGMEFRQRVRDGYLVEAGRQTVRIALIDAAQEVDVVQQAIRQAAQAWIDEASC